MKIKSLRLTHFRNISDAEIHCSPNFNLFHGNNAAGKTSILEAIYYLSNAKSFRTHQHDHVIHRDESALIVFAELLENQLALQRSRDGRLQMRMNSDNVKSTAQMARSLPVQLITSDSHRILSDGPKGRRQFLDWGLFHTTPLFFQQWKAFHAVLEHRNAALKARAPKDELMVWNREFAEAGERLHDLRLNYVASFLPFFRDIVAKLLQDVSIEVSYCAGWDEITPLKICLDQHVSRETMVGHSLFGPHRADLLLVSDGMPANDVLSQGQQKLISYALRLAQGLQFQSIMGQSPIYLIDDLPSELDEKKRTLVTQILSQLDAQVFVTGIAAADLHEIAVINSVNRMFHVEHGVIAVEAAKNVEFVETRVSTPSSRTHTECFT